MSDKNIAPLGVVIVVYFIAYGVTFTLVRAILTRTGASWINRVPSCLVWLLDQLGLYP